MLVKVINENYYKLIHSNRGKNGFLQFAPLDENFSLIAKRRVFTVFISKSSGHFYNVKKSRVLKKVSDLSMSKNGFKKKRRGE